MRLIVANQFLFDRLHLMRVHKLRIVVKVDVGNQDAAMLDQCRRRPLAEYARRRDRRQLRL